MDAHSKLFQKRSALYPALGDDCLQRRNGFRFVEVPLIHFRCNRICGHELGRELIEVGDAASTEYDAGFVSGPEGGLAVPDRRSAFEAGRTCR